MPRLKSSTVTTSTNISFTRCVFYSSASLLSPSRHLLSYLAVCTITSPTIYDSFVPRHLPLLYPAHPCHHHLHFKRNTCSKSSASPPARPLPYLYVCFPFPSTLATTTTSPTVFPLLVSNNDIPTGLLSSRHPHHQAHHQRRQLHSLTTMKNTP